MSFAGVALAVVYIFGLAPLLDVTYYFLLMACYLPIAFLFLPAHKNEKLVGWLSYLPAAATLGLTLFLAWKSRDLVYQTWVPAAHTWQLVVAAALSLVILEAARRSGGNIFLGIVAILGLYPVFADRMPDLLWGPPTTLARTLAFNVYSSDALLGVVTRVVGEVIIGFLILAALMVATGAADFFLKLAMALMGRARGGPAKVSVLASGFFGSLSGSIFGNVVSTGAVTIPAMKRAGFPPHYAGALEACASTGGMLMPPVMGAVAFIMADFTNTQYGVIVLAALIPSLLFYFGLYCHVDGYAARTGMVGTRQEDLPSIRQTLKEGWPFLMVLAFLVWGLVVMQWERLTPFYAAGLLIAITFFKRELRLTRNRLREIVFETGKLLAETTALLLPASFILGGLMATGVAPSLTAALVQMGGSSVVPILLIGMAVCIIFGMLGLIVAAYLMLALTLAPALEQVGGLNTLAVHLFIAYYSVLAAITPPIALAAFLASRISGSDPIKTSMTAARLGIVIYFIPVFFLFEPSLIFQGPLWRTAVWTVLNIAAIVMIAGASEGYMTGFGRLRTWARPVLFVAGLLIGFPNLITTTVGLAMLGAVLALRKLALVPPPAPVGAS
ncbi:MAG TPA: TRAP transporter fused permease subunit [Burkholderiales bacterium]|nr:TRAP transporter fused permease subunit [Burkholderiales bacterium]